LEKIENGPLDKNEATGLNIAPRRPGFGLRLDEGPLQILYASTPRDISRGRDVTPRARKNSHLTRICAPHMELGAGTLIVHYY